MICITINGVHRNEVQLIGGPNDRHAALRLRDEVVEVSRAEGGQVEIKLTMVTSEDVVIG